jgi:multiple antibiotic resistance protein
MEFAAAFGKAFIPLLVAMDPVGLLPLFLGMTEGMTRPQRQRLANQSLVTALAVAVVFVVLGKEILGLLGITVPDFMVAGGGLLFIIATQNIVTTPRALPVSPDDLSGAVPLGTPLIVGPAVLTMALILVPEHGYAATLAAIVANAALVRLVFYGAPVMTRLLGLAGSRAISKVVNLMLAAIAVMMVRRGVLAIVALAAEQ